MLAKTAHGSFIWLLLATFWLGLLSFSILSFLFVWLFFPFFLALRLSRCVWLLPGVPRVPLLAWDVFESCLWAFFPVGCWFGWLSWIRCWYDSLYPSYLVYVDWFCRARFAHTPDASLLCSASSRACRELWWFHLFHLVAAFGPLSPFLTILCNTL